MQPTLAGVLRKGCLLNFLPFTNAAVDVVVLLRYIRDACKINFMIRLRASGVCVAENLVLLHTALSFICFS